ncbi:MAG: 4Fe-4S binding protein [Dehalococcoidia bacterium]|nr:4Fe-4S binding protein [Dehalococcoidia bacterium]
MSNVTFKTDECKGCELCVNACPKGIIKLGENIINARGFRPAGVTNMEDCIGCAFCALMCPDVVIDVEK